MARRDFYYVEGAPTATRMVPAVSAVVRDNRGLLAMQLRTDNGFWAIPGGGIDIGETVEDAVHREIYEETGLRISIDALTGIYSDPRHVIAYSDGEVRQQFSICFACTALTSDLRVSSESTEVRFFAPNELAALKIHPAIRLRIEDGLNFNGQPRLR